jgi:hypothetical protein
MTRQTTFNQDEEIGMLSCIADLPSPRAVAWSLPECALQALKNAEPAGGGTWRLRDGVRDMRAGQLLFRAGCVEARGPYLGAFGMKVRRAAIELLAEREFGQ